MSLLDNDCPLNVLLKQEGDIDIHNLILGLMVGIIASDRLEREKLRRDHQRTAERLYDFYCLNVYYTEDLF